MPSPRVLNGALRGFLGTYLSRYSDFDGYWLFGFLVTGLRLMEVDLLHPPDTTQPQTPDNAARDLAVSKFLDQLAKAKLSLNTVASAYLVVQRLSEASCLAGRRARPGFYVLFRATAATVTGRVFTAEQTIFVAPHDPRFELRSGRVPS